jgi:hypothetical protein
MQRGAIRARQRDSAVWRGRRVRRRRRRRRRSVDLPLWRRECGADAGADVHTARWRGRRVEGRDDVVRAVMGVVRVEYSLVCAGRRVYAHALGVCAAVAGCVWAVP